MKNYLTDKELQYIHEHVSETIGLLEQLGKIPAPSHHEELRSDFVKQWLEAFGARGVYVDDALNVIYPVGCTDDNDIVVIMAHMDIVFPDTEPLPLRVENGKIFAPGIGDDTANLAQLLMCARYMTLQEMTPKCGILFVANSCERGAWKSEGNQGGDGSLRLPDKTVHIL